MAWNPHRMAIYNTMLLQANKHAYLQSNMLQNDYSWALHGTLKIIE